ncbi:hypothetical protein OJM10_gp23 [uncultured phage cr105_1]|uniref:hypothetical protein n=1 Tax=uncultured phage cr105_1 TaxID=2986415 RepID=UPI001C77E309|nr:hypothetical protein OJM10_gp23 [uncultured phage cr105_1]
MEKVLINKRGEAISFNTESNSITPMIDNITCNLYLTNKDGQVVTNNEVIDVKKGEFILYCRLWLKDKYITKTVIISDPTTTYDLNEWYKELNKQDNETI